MIDFDDIKSRHRIEDYLGRRGVEVKRASGGFKAKCPFHDGKSKDSLFIHGTKWYAKCWTRCGYIGSVIDVVMMLDGAENALAAAEILEGRPLTEIEKSRPKPERLARLQFIDGNETVRDLPRLLRADQLKEKPQHYFEIIALARGLHWETIKLAHDEGCLRFCREHWENDRGWKSADFNCYALLDVANPCNVQFRRLDADAQGKALPFWIKDGKPTKVLGRAGNNAAWPVGIDCAITHAKATLLLVEGTGDFLAAWYLRDMGFDVIPVAMFGAANSIDALALPFFERRKVVIVQQHDAAGEAASARWMEQLRGASARVRTALVPTPGEDLNDHLSAARDTAWLLEG